jgi:hypothetical protein
MPTEPGEKEAAVTTHSLVTVIIVTSQPFSFLSAEGKKKMAAEEEQEEQEEDEEMNVNPSCLGGRYDFWGTV